MEDVQNAQVSPGTVSQDGVADPKSAPKSGGKEGSGKPGSQAATDTDKKIAELELLVKQQSDTIASSQKMLEANQQMIGRLSDDVGKARQQTMQTVDMDKAGATLQNMLTDTDNPANAINAIYQAASAVLGNQQIAEQERARAYIDVTTRRPELKDVSYQDLMLITQANGGDLNNLNTGRSMETALTSLRSQRLGTRDLDAELKAAEKAGFDRAMTEARASGSVPGGTGTGVPAPAKEPDAVASFVRKMAESQGVRFQQ